MSKVYYSEIDPFCVGWLKNLIRAGLIPDGDVDSRSIADVQPEDIRGYAQHHFFAGISGWALALRLAGWADDREIVTGSCPCQPFSCAGKQRGTDDARHLWPHYFRLVNAIRPTLCVGEQVSAAIGKGWLDGVFADLEGAGYACEAFVLPACSVNAPHKRDRIWFAAARGALGDCLRPGLEGYSGDVDGWPRRARANRPVAEAGCGSYVANAPNQGEGGRGVCGPGKSPGSHAERPSGELAGHGEGCDVADSNFGGCGARTGNDSSAGHRHTAAAARRTNAWGEFDWIIGHDGKARRIPAVAQPCLRGVADGLPTSMDELCPGKEPDATVSEIESQVITLLASGVPARTGKLKGLGNAIVPALAAEFIGALMECAP